MTLQVLDLEQAPEAARELLRKAEENFGFVPNILGVMANSPALLEAYMTISASFDKTGFSNTEKQVVLLAVSHENGCHYCTSAHATIARSRGVDTAILDAIEHGRDLPDPRLDALYRFTRSMVAERGRLAPDQLDGFVQAGFKSEQVQDVIVGIAMKTLSNYNNHIAETPLDRQFQ